MKSLSETSVFKYTEMLSSNKITSCIKLLIDEKHGAEFIDEEQLEDTLYKIRHKSFNYSGKFTVMELYRKGIIKLVYNPKVKLTVAIPFFKYQRQDNNGYGVIINLSTYAKKDKDGNFKIDPTLLYALMLSASLSLISDKYQNLLSNGLTQLYADLVVNVLAKVVNVDATRREIYKFIFSKFMLMQMGYTEDRATEGAKLGISLDISDIEKIDLSCPIGAFENLETLVNHLKNIFTDANSLTLGFLFDKWMRSYGEASAFAIEDPTTFMFLFIALITNLNNIINIKAIERSANRNSSKLVMLFNKMETLISDIK